MQHRRRHVDGRAQVLEGESASVLRHCQIPEHDARGSALPLPAPPSMQWAKPSSPIGPDIRIHPVARKLSAHGLKEARRCSPDLAAAKLKFATCRGHPFNTSLNDPSFGKIRSNAAAAHSRRLKSPQRC